MNNKFGIDPKEWDKAKKEALKDIKKETTTLNKRRKCKKKLKS